MRYRKRLYSAVALVLIGALLCGAGKIKEPIILDTESNCLYEYVYADSILDAVDSNKNEARMLYNDKKILLCGKMGFKALNEFFYVTGENNEGKIYVAGDIDLKKLFKDDNIQNNVKNYDSGSIVALYGKVSINLLGGVSLSAEKIVVDPELPKEGDFLFIDGTVVNANSLLSRELKLKDGNFVKYKIPDSWKNIEINLKESGLGRMEGYLYALNNISDKYNEYFFISYVEHSLFYGPEPPYDKKEIEYIAEGVIKNITKKDAHLNCDIKTYYGKQYYYYTLFYNKNGINYRTEFIFQPDLNNGLIMYLYVYKGEAPECVHDVITTLRFVQ